MLFTRRTFFRYSGFSASLLAAPAFARPIEERTLKFVHTHTGETLTTTYACDGHYQPACLDRINHLLRDFRTAEVRAIDPALLDILFDLQVLADRADTFEVICGYRSPVTNARMQAKSTGVAKHSLHMEGRALDIRMTGFPTYKLRDLALSLKRGGVGYYAESDFVHVDTGRVRFW